MCTKYLRTDEREDLISSLKLVRMSAKECQHDLQFWKWVLIGAHSSLQAAIVFHLSFGNNLLVAKPRHAKKWLEAYRGGGDYPDMHTEYFMKLYQKAKSKQILEYHLTTTESQDRSVERLLGLRNEFAHFMPKGWSVELAGLPEICIDSLEIVSTLGDTSLRMRWEDEMQLARFEDLLNECFQVLRGLKGE